DYETSERRYPVIYMHDGQNLFDNATSYAGEWQADETMTALSSEGLAAIIVGLPNAGERRRIEYSPYDYQISGKPVRGEGDAYIAFLVEIVKPLIDAHFRTRTDAAATGIAGSSMGGLISLYGFLMRPDVFGLCGAFSTAYWFGENKLLETTRERASGHGRIYLDVGTREGDTMTQFRSAAPDFNTMYRDGVRELRDVLLVRGYVAGQSLMYVEDEGAPHNEAAWARRLPAALRFLLDGV
ncbi:MAG: alpha/beta hydrolase-fold protein, partial [Chloroflexota bacterium]|nr:alpha/beta hydrolase-fold protein [Chloroflexota bacterium]